MKWQMILFVYDYKTIDQQNANCLTSLYLKQNQSETEITS